MYKVNDIIYLYIKGLNKKKFKDIGLMPNRFAKIIRIQEDLVENTIDYTINLFNDKNKKDIIINSVANKFTFCDLNELIDIIRNLDISDEGKDKYIELIDKIIKEEDMKNIPYKYF